METRWNSNHISAIVVTITAAISTICETCFHMNATFAGIFFFCDPIDNSDRSPHMETSLEQGIRHGIVLTTPRLIFFSWKDSNTLPSKEIQLHD